MELWRAVLEEPRKIARCIEHTNVKVESTESDIKKLCGEVLKYGFHAAVLLPEYTKLARELLGGRAKVVSVVGFPYGIQPTPAKVAEVKAMFRYVDEFDMVMNRNTFLNKNYRQVVDDIREVVKAASPKTVKVIIETPSLTGEQIKAASKLVMKGGAHFVKTAVGYAGSAKVEHVKIIKSVVKDKLQVKASGGIKSFRQALEMIRAGASRIGTSYGVKIIESIG